VERQSLLVADKHWHLRGVLARIEDLLDLVVVGIEDHRWPPPECCFARDQIVAEDSRRRREAEVSGVDLGVQAPSLKTARGANTAGGANTRQWQLADEFPFLREALELRVRVLEVIADEPAPDPIDEQ